MTKFDSADVEAERLSDELFETLDDHARIEVAGGRVEYPLNDEVQMCLERRCRAWFASQVRVWGAP